MGNDRVRLTNRWSEAVTVSVFGAEAGTQFADEAPCLRVCLQICSHPWLVTERIRL